MTTREPDLPPTPASGLSSEEFHARQLAVLNEIARIATLELETRPMMQRITDALARAFKWEFVALITIDEDQETFVCEAVSSVVATEIQPGYSRTIGSGVVGEVAATGRAILVDDVRACDNYIETMPGALSEICVPIHHHDQLVAILNLESTRLSAFEGELPLLTTVAEQISAILASARHYQELRQRARLMEMMSEVSREALEVTDLDELLDRVTTYIHQQFPLAVVAIVYIDRAKNERVLRAYAGQVDVKKGSRWSNATGVAGRCFRTGETQIVLDVSSDRDYVSVNDSVVAEIVVPIRYHGEILGLLDLESVLAEAFTPANVLAFEAFADQIAGAIHMAAVNGLLETRTRELETANEALKRLSTLDSLTGIANRRRFDDAFHLEWRRAARKRAPISVLLIDIDFFKPFNDAYGHPAGDDALKRVAEEMQHNLNRAADLVARYGGEEFVVLLPDTDVEQARIIAERLRRRIAALEIEHQASSFGRITVSIGAAAGIGDRNLQHADALVSAADVALYEAKRGGRNCVRVKAASGA